MRCLPLLVALASFMGSDLRAELIHPGLLHSREDLARMRAAVAAKQKPIIDGFEVLAKHPGSSANYQLRGPFEEAGRGRLDEPGGRHALHAGEFGSDAQAAYHNALMWALTGEKAHARKSIQILNAWSNRHKRITGIDGILLSGLQGIKFANAAELIRHTDARWPEEEVKRCEAWFRNGLLPIINNYGTFANCNWDVAALQTKMAIAVFCNDHEMFEETVRYAVDGSGNGSITHTVVYPSGQSQEATRKQHYAQLGLGLLSNVAEQAWNQGVDLYGWAHNRILKGMEYNVAYGLGVDVPYQHHLDRTGKYGFRGRHQFYDKPSTVSRGNFRPIFEQPYQHYVKRVGLKAPYMQQVVRKYRPEGCSGDQMGLGTLAFWRPQVDRSKALRIPGPPSGLVARTIDRKLRLTWVPSVDPLSCRPAPSYQVLSSPDKGGPYLEVSVVTGAHHLDIADHPLGQRRYYVIKAQNEKGPSKGSVPFAACAGLPLPWMNRDIGEVQVAGYTSYNGTSYRLEAEGKGIGGKEDQLHFAYRPWTGEGSLTARVPFPPSSGWTQLGVMMRESLEPDSAFASALLLPEKWRSGLVVRTKKGTPTVIASAQKLRRPFVEKENRLMKPYWMRLTREGNTFSAFFSTDGETWKAHGSVEVPMKETVFVGLPASSQLPKVTTTVMYDRVTVDREGVK